MASFNEDSVEKKLKTVNNTQDSIQSLSLWIIHHKSHHARIVELWLKVLKKSVHPSHRLTLFYLCNDVVQTCKKKKAHIYNATFKQHLTEAARLVRDVSVKNKIERIFKIWQERGVYDAKFVTNLQAILSGKPIKPNVNDPISPVGSPYEPSAKIATLKVESPPPEPPPEKDIDDSARILAEFKPHEMIEQMTTFRRQELEIQIRSKQLGHLRLDASSLAAVKQLKDRAHGNEFSNQFEDSCTKLEDLVRRQTQHVADQKALLETLQTSETFYDAQYREARIVANAYKNFGARINNMKKKLDEMKKTMPKIESPIPSPDINAPSPENSPSFAPKSSYDYNSSNTLHGFQDADNPYNNWKMNGKDNFSGNNAHQDSPPDEAPSPEGTPPGLNLDGSDNGPTSLDSRLEMFMDRSHRAPEKQKPQPSYTPASMNLAITSSHSKQPRITEEDGGNTPLDDEAPTTPVQDEHTTPPPKKNNSPPKKENPIDFLSRLISQTQTSKTPTTKTGAASFLDSLTMLSTASGKSSSKSSPADVDMRPPVSVRGGDTMISPQQQTSHSPWAWNTSNHDTVTVASQSSSPRIMSQPTSPSTPFSRPPPTMVPPPPMPPLTMPPPIIPQMSPPVSINLSIPPPPPPPLFTNLVSGPSMDFSTPPPSFHQQNTSPGQKENWPDKIPSSVSDHSGVNRSVSSNSVLTELVPSKSYDEVGVPENKPMVSDAMEIVSDDEEELDALTKDSDPEMDMDIGMGNEGHEEFANKLKEKTAMSSNEPNLKSSVASANLVSISVAEEVTNKKDDMMEDVSSNESLEWMTTTKTHKSKKSRSRSRSREKVHKHKKKKKHKRKNSDMEEYDTDMRVDKKTAARSSSKGSKDSKYSRYEERGKYDDRLSSDRGKYDRYEDKKYSSSSSVRESDVKSKYSSSSHRDSKDPRAVEAYAQAFIQQYSQARFGSGYNNGSSMPSDTRRSSYNKY